MVSPFDQHPMVTLQPFGRSEHKTRRETTYSYRAMANVTHDQGFLGTKASDLVTFNVRLGGSCAPVDAQLVLLKPFETKSHNNH